MASVPSGLTVPVDRARWRETALALTFLLLVLGAYADPLFTHRNFIGRDILPYNLPLERAVHDAWHRGQVPVWWDAISGGRPLLPNPNAGVFYPVRVALSRVSFPWAMRLFPILHWIVAGWGMLRLCRVLGGSLGAAWIGGVSFAFSGVLVSEVFYYNFLPGASWLPWSLWALARPGGARLRRIVPIALVYGLMLLAGDAFSLSIALLAAVLWIVFETMRGDRAESVACLLGGLILAGLLALPQLVATALVAPTTRRMVSGIRLQEVLGFSIPPARLLELAVPYPFGDSWSMDVTLDWGTSAMRRFFATFFVGPIALFAFLHRFREPPRGLAFARALTIACASLAILGNLVPEAWGKIVSPIPLRYPEKFMLGAAFGMALAAGMAVDAVRRERPRAFAVFGAALVLALVAVAARLGPATASRLATAAVRAPAAVRGPAGDRLPGVLAQAGLLWVLSAVGIRLLARAGRAPLVAALALLTVVPVAANRAIAQTAHESVVLLPTPFARVIAKRDPAGVFRGLDESLYEVTRMREIAERGDWGGSEHFRQSWVYYTQALWGRGAVFNGDLDAGDFSRFESLRQISYVAALRRDSAAFFASLSLRYGSRLRDQDAVAGFRPFGGDAFRFWDENPDARPEIRLVERWREAPGPVEAFAVLPGLAPGEVVIETQRTASGSARSGSLRVLRRTPESLSLKTESPDPTWLFVLRGDWEYRTVLLDGHPVEVRPAQLAFSSVAVPPGTHRIEWHEEAPGLEVSRWGPVAAVLVLAVGWLSPRRMA